jgi:hypothetical protein
MPPLHTPHSITQPLICLNLETRLKQSIKSFLGTIVCFEYLLKTGAYEKFEARSFKYLLVELTISILTKFKNFYTKTPVELMKVELLAKITPEIE